MNSKRFPPASFKARVALAAMKEGEAVDAIASRFGISRKDVLDWRVQLKLRAHELFEVRERR
ncbi:hypothetical protein [Alloalcanivorax xenomutans]|jgi:transposase-like protein|uniref:hypothetical protein n=1 Tax=Alloalcanivorax xenomutans TaxID=1094342 RepID=UPI0003B7FAAE|nr:hypothetical protein [Alloalcanivorax xenomutans]ERS15563.1 hypothetical protein Q668_00615 [Alcanivorax sp. PN-3]PHS71381.1 MAG: hypothetical protein COB00_03080 [Alcanivorax sp.]CUR46269.1 hypothetical protein BN2364_1828 [Alloalcanivorax xenomutans]SOC20344.1 hypothetical protein SAMN05877962_116113 [Alloalcanivorax xenomutans]|tara:strand:- start:3777 stop:3962 length:186 start_codon:yes stop_codon:yes gene_type:complete